MPLKVRNSARRRRRKTPDEKLPERPRESTSSSAAAEVMAPTRMKLRVRRRDNVAATVGGEDQEEEEEEEERSGRRSSSRRKTSSNASSTTSVAAAAPAPSASPPPTSSASARAVMAAEEASPDSKCPICLDRFNNLAYLDRCLHRFCFPCIQEWSHNKAECPLCKQPFASILHSVRAEDDFKEYTLRPPPANSSVAATVAMVAAMASAARSDHQMRLMLRRHRGTDSGETAATTRRRRRERGGGRGGGRRSGMWEWYLDSPPLTLPPLPHHLAVSPVVAEDSEEGEDVEEQRVRRGADLAERGVIFEGLTGLSGAVAPVAPNDRASRRLMTRLLARQRLQRGGGTVRRLRERETVTFRRALYRSSIRVRGVAGVNGNQGQQQRDITAESFRRNPTHLNRLRPWLRRELTVLYGAHGSLVDIVQRIIMARLARHGLEDTPTVEEELRPFLLARTDHFLHELVSFARSPLSLESYDTQAAYEPPDAALELDGMSSSTDSSSIIAISEGEEEERPAEGRSEERLLARAGGVHDVDVLQSGSCLSLSAWDDETPGPSYSTAEPSCSLASPLYGSAQQEVANEEGGERQGEEEECLIVGYKKPIAERTPELVQLSSDTEEEEDEKKKKEDAAEKLPALPCGVTPPPPLSYLPTIPPSTSGAYGHERDDGPKEKDGEADGRRARSWSGSSGRSRKSVCTLSPATPGASECQQERESWTGDGKSSGEKRRRKRRRRGREKSGERLRKSGTMYNPNRSIYPAMMCQRSRSPSPFHSSVESGSPLPPSPPDSTWEHHCSQLSPLTSSVSSASRSSSSSPSSSSPICFSPQLSVAAMPSLLPNHHGEKPGGKRKYKSRHLDSDDKDPTWRPKRREKEGGRRKGRDGGRRRERQRRDVGESNKRSRADRSPSVEIIYEGTVTSNATQSPASKRRRKRHRKTQQSSPPVIITLDSDSSRDGGGNKNDSSGSSSPLSSQQTVDFSDLPPLPLVQSSSGMGGAVDAEIGELPVDILDRGSDGSEAEPAGPIAVDNSDHDVENVGESSPLLGSEDDDDDDDDGPMRMRKSANQGRGGGDPTTSSLASDSRLLATILNDLKGIAAPKRRPYSPDARKKRCKVGQDSYSNDIVGYDSSPSRAAIRPPPPPGEQPKDHQVREEEEGKDVPPLLKQASPVRSYNRNTPPPLKHKDAGSPHPSPISPINLHSPHASVGGVDSRVDLRSNPAIDSRLLPEDDHAIPPISTLKRHYTSALALMGGLTSTSSISEPVYSHSSSVSENSSTSGDRSSHPELNTFHSKLHSSRDRTKEVTSSGLKPAPIDLHPVNSVSPVHFNSAHADSTSRGCREKTLSPNSCLVAPVDLHPSSGCDVFSGVDRNDPSPPVFVSSVDSRTQNISSPADSHSSGKRENLLCSGVSSVPTTAPRLSPIEVHSISPKSTVDLHSSSAAGLTDSKASSIVNHGKRSPYGCLPPIDLHRTSPLPPANIHPSSRVIDEHSNHTALSAAATFLTSYKNCSSQSDPTVDSHAKILHRTDSKPRNHFDPRSNPQFPVDAYSEHNLPVGLQPPVDSHLKNSRTDHRITSSPRSVESPWNPDASIDAHPDSHTPETKRDVNV